MIYVGNTPCKKVYFGGTSYGSVYVGDTLVWVKREITVNVAALLSELLLQIGDGTNAPSAPAEGDETEEIQSNASGTTRATAVAESTLSQAVDSAASPIALPDAIGKTLTEIGADIESVGVSAPAITAEEAMDVTPDIDSLGVSAPALPTDGNLENGLSPVSDGTNAPALSVDGEGGIQDEYSVSGATVIPIAGGTNTQSGVSCTGDGDTVSAVLAALSGECVITSIADPLVRISEWTDPVQTGDTLYIAQAYEATQTGDEVEVN